MSIVVVYRYIGGYIGVVCLRDGGVYRGSRQVGGTTRSDQLVMSTSSLELGNDLYDVGR